MVHALQTGAEIQYAQTDKYTSAVAEINGWIEYDRSKLDKIFAVAEVK